MCSFKFCVLTVPIWAFLIQTPWLTGINLLWVLSCLVLGMLQRVKKWVLKSCWRILLNKSSSKTLELQNTTNSPTNALDRKSIKSQIWTLIKKLHIKNFRWWCTWFSRTYLFSEMSLFLLMIEQFTINIIIMVRGTLLLGKAIISSLMKIFTYENHHLWNIQGPSSHIFANYYLDCEAECFEITWYKQLQNKRP